MSPLERLKFEATTLEAQARASGHPIKHSAALEQVAKRHGYDSWRACLAMLRNTAAAANPATSENRPSDMATKPYRSAEWRFALDIPARWNSFPAVPTNSPYEVIRFASHEDGTHVLIVFRAPYDPQKTPVSHAAEIQNILAGSGFSNFATGETTIGSGSIVTLDFDKTTDDGLWSCRHYFVIADTLVYTLGFGTNKRAAMFGIYDRMAKSFSFEP